MFVQKNRDENENMNHKKVYFKTLHFTLLYFTHH